MRHLKVGVIVLLVLALAATLGVSCRVAEKPVEGGTFRAFLKEPSTLDPAHAWQEGILVAKQIFDGLIDYDPKTMKVVPAMAESWKSNKDATVWTFKLKKGVKFHNGRECKAEDFIYSWSRVANKKTASESAYHMEPIKGFGACQEGKADTLEGLKAVDDYTLEVTLEYPYAEFPAALGHVVFSPVPEEEVKKSGDKFGENPVGTGPFKFVEWKRNQQLALERNDDYYKKKAHLDKIAYKIFADVQPGYLEFQAGNLDDCEIPGGQVKAAKKKYADRVLISPMQGVYSYLMIQEAPPWKGEKELRQALNYAIDRKAIVNTVWEEARLLATGIAPKGIAGFQEKAMPYVYDEAKAKELLKKAGYPGGKGLPEITLAYNTERPEHAKVAQAFQAQCQKVGIKISIKGYEMGALREGVMSGDISFFLMDWVADYPTMDNFVYSLFYSESFDNYTGYSNKAVDDLLIKARGELDADKRIKLYREAEKKILQDAPLIPIVFDETTRVIGTNVKGYIRTPMDDTPMERVWLAK